MKIATRLIASASVVGIITVGLGTFAMNRLANVRDAEQIVEQDVVPSARELALMAVTVDRIRMAELGRILSTTSKQHAQFDSVGSALLSRLDVEEKDYQEFSDTPEEIQRYREFSSAWAQYLDLRTRINSLSEIPHSDSATALLAAPSQRAFDLASGKLDALTALTIQQAADAIEQSQSKYRLAQVVIILGVVGSLLVAISGAIGLIRGIAAPMNSLVGAAEKVSLGDLSQRVALKTRDEFGKLAETFNRMAEALANSHETLERRVVERTAELNTEKEGHREARQLAELANVAKSEFLANMSHELRTPLNSVIGFADILLKNKNQSFTKNELGYLDRIHANGRHLLGLINSVLDLAKVESGQMAMEVTSVSLAGTVQETLSELEPQAALRNVRLVAELPDSPATIDCDREKLRQIVVNLVSNAVKFSDNGDVRVVVRTTPNGKPLAIDVRDTGIGIAPDRIASVFDAFQQADNTTARKFGGTGLGLTISQSLARLMGFEIVATSKVGAGSTFSLIFATERAEDHP